MSNISSRLFVENEFERVVTSVLPPYRRNEAREAIRKVIAEYDKPHRVYHSVDHLAYALYTLQRWERRLSLSEYLTAFAALALHDYVYEIPAGDRSNEALSADAHEWFLRETALGGFVSAQSVRQAILATEGHNVATLIDLVVCWCDLWGLSRSRKVVESNGDKIRREYTQVYTDEEYSIGRRKFLESYSSPFKLYPSAPLRLRLNAAWLNFRANRHMNRELRTL